MMAAMAVRVLTSGGPTPKFVCNVFLYMCAKFGAFVTKHTIYAPSLFGSLPADENINPHCVGG